MANLITSSRLFLLGIVVVTVYQLPASWLAMNIALLVLMFISDGLDGYVARQRGETSQFGAMFDIASDRIVELTMWLLYSDLGLIPMWIPLLFIVRGVIVDAIRSTQAAVHRQTPFSTMRTSLGRFLVAGKSLRVFYAVLKAIAFCCLMLEYYLQALAYSSWAPYMSMLSVVSVSLVAASVLICVLRGVPVIVEYIYVERQTLPGVKTRASIARPSG